MNTNNEVHDQSSKKRKRSERVLKNNKRIKINGEAIKSTSKSNTFLTNDLSYLASFREKHSISIEGPITNFKPFESFTEAGFPEALLKTTSHFSHPTPIQSQCWPILLSKHDVIGIAQTGSGKTLAFGLPGLTHVKSQPEIKNPAMLVLAPTRELAMQTYEVLKDAEKNLRVVCVYGGVGHEVQKKGLKNGAHVVVATPGRLLDFINSGDCELSEVGFLVLDEADRMLDMGFEKDIRQIIGYLPSSSLRQTAMFSATWPTAIQKLAAEFLNSPIRVSIGTGSEGLSANGNVKQIVEVIQDRDRDDRLTALLKDYHNSRKNRILVFVLYKKEATRLETYLNKRGWKVGSIHSNKSQNQRTAALQAFKDGTYPLLVATDVAARGLDIPQVEYVINYSFPLTIEDYVHRIGRTGRAGAKGTSHTFFQSHDKLRAGELVNVLKENNQEVPEGLLKWGLTVKKKEPKLGKINLNLQNKEGHITFDSDDE